MFSLRKLCYATRHRAIIGQSVITGLWYCGPGKLVGNQQWYFGRGYRFETGLLFREITLPSDAYDIEARLKLSDVAIDVESHVNSRIYMENNIQAKPFDFTLADYLDRPRCETYVDWDNIIEGRELISPDFGAILAELIANKGPLRQASITIFWGDKDNRTPVPSPGRANVIAPRGVPELEIKFNATRIPVFREPVTFSITNYNELLIETKTDDIFNDIRVILPKSKREIDYSTMPPTIYMRDVQAIQTDEVSIRQFGRRTFKIIGLANPESADHIAYMNYIKKRKPQQYAKLQLVADENNILKVLDMNIFDKVILDTPDVKGTYCVEHINYQCQASIPSIILTMKRIDYVPQYFQLDIDALDDIEVCLG